MSTKPTVIVCGLARNGGEEIEGGLNTIAGIEAVFPSCHSLIATNDNTDDTASLLMQWAASRSRREVLVYDGLATAIPERVDRIATVRNLCLQRVWQVAESSFAVDSCFLVLLDLDGPNSSLDISVLARAIAEWRAEWDAIFANQRNAYYDVYALRHHRWCADDCWIEVERSRRRFLWSRNLEAKTVRRLVYQRQYLIDQTLPPIEVDSAFGGLGIYRLRSVAGCWYGSRSNDGRVVCEHVVFHAAMRAQGRRLFILPWLLNTSPSAHLGPGSGKPIPESMLIPWTK